MSKYPVSVWSKLAIAVHPTPKACMLKSRVVPMGNVMNSSSFGEMKLHFLSLSLKKGISSIQKNTSIHILVTQI